MYLRLVVFISVLVHTINYAECVCPQIISRNSWGAQHVTNKRTLRSNPPPYVVVHHSATIPCTTQSTCESSVKNIQSYHINSKGWNDIAYNFLIGGDGNIYEGRGWNITGAHVVKYNSRSIGICLIGNFEETDPSSQQIQALQNLITCGVETGRIKTNYRIIGHRQGSSTTCPGHYLYNKIKTFFHWEPNPN